MEARKLEEIEFHNKLRDSNFAQRWSPEVEDRIQSDPMWSNFKYYSVEKKNLAFVTEWLQEYCRNAMVLDYCCGNGDDSIRIAKDMMVSRIVGIDISDVAIKNCKIRAEENGFEDKTEFLVMDAEHLEFADNTFDTIVIYGVLHHLKLDQAFSELARVLKPDGRIIATEALRHNPLIHLYRKRTPHLRTAWEVDHILGRSELKLAENYFGEVEKHFFDLTTLIAVLLRRTVLFSPLLTVLEGVDNVLLKMPGIQWMAWKVVFTLAKPKKARTE